MAKWKPTIKKITTWRCGCGSLYPSRTEARWCCICPVCGKRGPKYFEGVCERCHAVRVIAELRSEIADVDVLRRRLEEKEEELKKLDATLAARAAASARAATRAKAKKAVGKKVATRMQKRAGLVPGRRKKKAS